MNYIKSAPENVDKDTRERAMEMARPLTPKSERRVAGAIRPISLQTYPGLCSTGAKCIRKNNHPGLCWPE